MKIRALLVMMLVAGAANIFSQAPADGRKLADIRDRYKKVNDQIAEMERDPQYSSIFVTELVINKNDASYPAVGIFQSTVRFYYTYGDREKNPYPYKLLKVMVASRVSNRREASEYLFSEAGEMIFSFDKKDDAEKRGYFEGGRLMSYQKGDAIIAPGSAEAKQNSMRFLLDAKKLRTIFVNSL